MTSALYSGHVIHRRLKPRTHLLRYRVFWILFDLDDLNALTKRLRFFSLEKVNLFSFHNTDHGDGSRQPLRAQVQQQLAAAGLDLAGGAIRLLCMPRILGYAFNPISIYYCYDRANALAALIYQVHNTFGERHNYVVPIDRTQTDLLQHHCAKALYVSPFIGMDIAYQFKICSPLDRISLHIQASDPQGPVMTASLHGQRRALSDTALLHVFLTHPLLTLKVTAGIHWEALKLWLKGVELRPRQPGPPPATRHDLGSRHV